MPKAGTLAANLLGFGRLLRRAGLLVGPAEMLAGAEALTRIDLADRRQAQAALRATLVHRQEHQHLFDHAFRLWWRDPEAGRHAAAMDALSQGQPPPRPPPGGRRLAEALGGQAPPPQPPRAPEREVDASLTVSAAEALARMDFEAMGAAELAAARGEIRRLSLPLDHRPTRRFRPDPAGPRADLRATLRHAMRQGGEVLELRHTRRVERPPPLVAICDISGSMARYAQVLLHFLHAVTNDRDRVSTFLFGTRLTNITRPLRHRDAEVAFEMVSHLVPDWSGGTRIGEALDLFNRQWGRRVLGQGAVVLLITDGLERGDAADLARLAAATERLRNSCRRLIWLNPLLRYAGFQPRSQGIRTMLPLVHEHRPVHNIESLRALVRTLSGPAPRPAATGTLSGGLR
ncbi:VWA domain-containing protein [Pseudoroseomonas rhizosphaerae]|uniref:VWA domain-containing protein n=1 Tax=Teichococcus rhizosphaerae TaxID=1335062 RepID=A0A2C6ZEF8_9PROT|nr:VWA domain-containing protein [Pseudoroseomonas rhizosphaerae]PHK96851.1 VWA domain-containing protein [Pseudoroseomonas rhizosphaerae]